MAIFELDGEAPELPGEGRYWIAESANVIGRVRLKPDASVWFGAVLRGDNKSRTTPRCTPIPVSRCASGITASSATTSSCMAA